MWKHKKFIFAFSVYGFCMQFMTTLQVSNTSPLLNFQGASAFSLSTIWLGGPVTGLISALIFGQLSDMTESRFGKRKPYLVICGIIVGLVLIGMVLSRFLITTIVLLWIFYICINGCMWSGQAWAGDILSEKELPKLYAYQAGAGLIGTVLAASLPFIISISWPYSESPLKNQHWINHLPHTVFFSFLIAGIIMISGSIWVGLTCKEEVTTETSSLSQFQHTTLNYLMILLKGFAHKLKNPPLVIKKIMLSQLFLWVSIYILWVYLPLAISQHFYGMPAGAQALSNKILLEKGAQLASVGYAFFQASSTLVNLLLPWLLKKITEMQLFALLLFIGGGFLILAITTSKIVFFLVGMGGIGLLNGGIYNLPIIALQKEVSVQDRGISLGIFNMTVTIPQILSGLLSGHIYIHLCKAHADKMIFLAGICILLSGVIATITFFRDSRVC